MIYPEQPFARFLIGYFGVIEGIHLLALARAGFLLAQTNHMPFPALPPPSGWSAQVIPLLLSMGALDAVNAMIALLFVYGFFRKARWCWAVGGVSLTAATYSAILYAVGTISSGAWAHHPWSYGSVALAYLPVGVLAVVYGMWVIQGRLSYR